MKVHIFQISVMWLFLDSMFCQTTDDNKVVYTYNNKRELNRFKEPCYHKKIRPPPGCGGL